MDPRPVLGLMVRAAARSRWLDIGGRVAQMAALLGRARDLPGPEQSAEEAERAVVPLVG
jgi:hypothetical protein